MPDIHEEIKQTVKDNKVVLFMKGTQDFPMCGFSATVVGVLEDMDVDFKDVNVMADENLRQGIKTYSDWPTIPQLYVNGEFIGGCDIVREMHEDGELESVLKNSK